MIARATLFGKAPARLVLLAGVLVLIATTALLAPSGAVAKVTKVKRPDVRIIQVANDGYYVTGGAPLQVRVDVINRGQAATTLTYKATVTPLVGDAPGLKPVKVISVKVDPLKPGEGRAEAFPISDLPIGRYALKVEAMTVGEVKKGDNVHEGDAFSVIPKIWRGTAGLAEEQAATGVKITADAVPNVTFTFKEKTGRGFVYTAAGTVTQTVSGGYPEALSGSGTYDITPDQSTLILKEDMLSYEALGFPPEAAGGFYVTATFLDFITTTTSYVTFGTWLETGPKDKLPEATTLAGTYSRNEAAGTPTWTWNLSAATE